MNMRIDKLQPIAKVLRTTPAYLMGSDESEENNEDSQQQKLLTNYNTDQTKLIDYSVTALLHYSLQKSNMKKS